METRLNTYFVIPASAVDLAPQMPEFAFDDGGVIAYRTLNQSATLVSKTLNPLAVVDIRPSRTYTDDITYTVTDVNKLFHLDDFPRDIDGNIEIVIYIQTFHPSAYKDFINEMQALGYLKYSDDLMFDWDSMDKLLREASI